MELKTLWARAQQLAEVFDDSTPSRIEFKTLLEAFKNLAKLEDPSLQRIAHMAQIFDGHWSQRQWLNLLVPLERYLDRRLTDADIIGALPDSVSNLQIKVPLVVVADHWRSAFNVGSLFRLADGFGINKIYLVGYTPTPDHPAVVKTAMGSIQDTPWEHVESLQDLIPRLKAEGYAVWAMETTPDGQNLGDTELPSPLAVVLGNERFGLDPKTLRICDGTLRIPLRGAKNSMNVANCVGIIAFEWCRQHAK